MGWGRHNEIYFGTWHRKPARRLWPSQTEGGRSAWINREVTAMHKFTGPAVPLPKTLFSYLPSRLAPSHPTHFLPSWHFAPSLHPPLPLNQRRQRHPLQHSCLESPMDGGAWWAAVHRVAKSQTQLSDFPFTFHFPALEKEMATHSSVLAWRIPGTGEPSGLPSMGSHRVGHD